MTLKLRHRALYAAFDRFPSAKGAATRIRHVAPTLFERMDGGVLYALGDERLPLYQREGSIEVLRFSRLIRNFLERALSYGERLSRLLESQPALSLCHFRDPWSGVPILTHPGRRYRTVYEINGLPSIELSHAYPGLSDRTLKKVRAEEQLCWLQADRVVTPSHTLRGNLIRLGVPAQKIHVVPNGASRSETPPLPATAPRRYLLYFGALQSWQGVDVLLKAFALLRDFDPLELVVCSSVRQRQAKPLRRLAHRLDIAERTRWFYRLPKAELAPWLAHAELTVAPLTECPRNTEQGCCPLKILESMAAGVPVVASDLPVVREIFGNDSGNGETGGVLVRPDRPSELSRTLRILLDHPREIRRLGERARQQVERDFSWQKSLAPLRGVYRSLLDLDPAGEPESLADLPVEVTQ